MRNFILASASLLLSLFWLFVSVSESRSVEVQSGEEVTLMCSNFSSTHTRILWYKMNRSEPRCLFSMFQSDEPATFCSGFKKGKFEMTSNSSTLFLNIKLVDSSDAGLYFCGYRIGRDHVIVEATFLEVQDVGLTTLLSIICAALTVFFISVITCLAVRLIKLQRESRLRCAELDHCDFSSRSREEPQSCLGLRDEDTFLTFGNQIDSGSSLLNDPIHS